MRLKYSKKMFIDDIFVKIIIYRFKTGMDKKKRENKKY
jgi:hypothetical protein